MVLILMDVEIKKGQGVAALPFYFKRIKLNDFPLISS